MVDGVRLTHNVPQAHKVALTALSQGDPVRRYRIVIGHVTEDIPAGGWVNDSNLKLPQSPNLKNLPVSTRVPTSTEPLKGYTFQGYQNSDGTVGTRNILAVSNTVQCVSGVDGKAVERIRQELLPRYPNVDNVVALDHTYGCGVAIDAPGAAVPIRTVRNIRSQSRSSFEAKFSESLSTEFR